MTENAGKIVEVNIPSELKFVDILDSVVSRILKQMEFDEDAQSEINLALIEAGTNAIKHGNENDPKKTVKCAFKLEDNKLTIQIKDSGKGFDPSKIDASISPENLLEASGRGIFLVNVLMDEVEYKFDLNGTEVRMVKYKR